jgi:hypothetical protein
MQRRIVCCLNLVTGLCSAAVVLGCSPKGTFIRAEGIPPERSAVAKGTAPEVYVAGVRGYSSPAALSGGEPIWAFGLFTV